MAEPATPELAPHYYRDNFFSLCDTVRERYDDLLLGEERELLARLHSLPFAAQCLYVRLVSRSGPWFREARLDYPEIGAINKALDALLDAGLAAEPAGLSTEELGRLFTRGELSELFGAELASQAFVDKQAQLAAIEALSLPDDGLLERLYRADGARIVTPEGVDLLATLQLLFFGNRRQSLTEFVLSDLGVVRYFDYDLDREYRQFASRAALDEYLACAALHDLHWELVELGMTASLPALATEVLALEPQHESSEGRFARLCNALARDLERAGELELALSLYRRSPRHPARERQARILERQEHWEDARALSDDILAAPWCEEEQEAAQRILPRVRRKLGDKPAPQPRDSFERIDLVLPEPDGRVERASAAALAADWAEVHYVENALMNTLFGLAFWEEIFAPVAGAFQHPYQGAPADMYSGRFLARRRGMIERRLDTLRNADLAELLRAAYARYHPYQNLSLIHISEPTRPPVASRMPSSA